MDTRHSFINPLCRLFFSRHNIQQCTRARNKHTASAHLRHT
uniref:Uncharacterized protein n=1 Tax=Anguilla anguilla TaxID=7936 RepID=A0A0E9Q870_ANGAN